MEQPVVVASVTYTAVCGSCAAQLTCWGVQSLFEGELRWDVESTCAACGSATAACGAALPSQLRDRLLAACGTAILRVVAVARATRITAMQVLRSHLAIGLTEAKPLLGQVLAGAYTGTLPETEHLAHALRAAGVDATADHPDGTARRS